MKIMLKYCLLLFFVSFFSIIALIFVNQQNKQFFITILGAGLTLLTLFYCKYKMKQFIKPSDNVLNQMSIKPIPTSYISNKYNIISKVFGYMSYLIVLSNYFAYCAYKYSKIVEQPGGYKKLIIQDDYMLWAIIMLMIGFVSFGLWAKLRQVYCIYNEKDDELDR